MDSYAEDFLHDALLLFLRKPEKHIQSVLSDESRGDNHLYNLILSMIDHKTTDSVRDGRCSTLMTNIKIFRYPEMIR